MKILATGVTGKMGPCVLNALTPVHEVTAFVLEGSIDLPIRLAHGDIRSLDDLCAAADGQDAIIHMAGRPNADAGDDDTVFALNVGGTFNVLEAARRCGVRKVVYASSGRAYGIGFRPPYTPPDYIPVDEEHPLRPRDTYGISKMMAENLCRLYGEHMNMDVFCLRFPWVATLEHLDHLEQLLASPAMRTFGLWSWVDERDMAEPVRLAVENDVHHGYRSYLISADDTAAAEDSLDLLERFFPAMPRIVGEIAGRQSLFSNRKARRELGFRPQYTLENGLLGEALAHARKPAEQEAS